MKHLLNKLIFLFLLSTQCLFAQTFRESIPLVNIEHYKLSIELNDDSDLINATMEINLQFKRSTNYFILDLENLDETTGKGMQVESVHQNNVAVDFKHENNILNISPKHNFQSLTYTYTIIYSGIPSTGLIIGENTFGDRTFFADNWPNRAHRWFPCIDHPLEKATVEFLVQAPNHYKVISNGILVEETELENNLKLTHYQTKKPLPTKVMVIGVANFEIDSVGTANKIPVSSWVYPQAKEQGFQDFSKAKEILEFFTETIGEFPFEKLANVQSTTEYGGMENASAIFYHEKSITGEGKIDALMAHEIAHQWFGDSATEVDWPHIWLSEGFATYFADLYVQKSKGDSVFQQRMLNERKKVFDFYKKQQTPIVDTKTTNIVALLNANSYQKGAWVLHMLRKKLGDEAFFKGIKSYYNTYKYSNASTLNFKSRMESASGKNLDVFFKQWLTKAEYPVLKSNWIYYNNKVRLMLEQIQATEATAFEFPLDVELIYIDDTSEIKTIHVSYKTEPFVIECSKEVKALKFDPNNWLLFQMAEK